MLSITEELYNRHGKKLVILSAKDFKKMDQILKKYPKVRKELQKLDVWMTPFNITAPKGYVSRKIK